MADALVFYRAQHRLPRDLARARMDDTLGALQPLTAVFRGGARRLLDERELCGHRLAHVTHAAVVLDGFSTPRRDRADAGWMCRRGIGCRRSIHIASAAVP